MSGHAGPQPPDEQPGLELNYHPGLEVDTRSADGLQVVSQAEKTKPDGPYHAAVGGFEASGLEAAAPEAAVYGQGYQSVPTGTAEATATGAAAAGRSRKKLWIVVGGVIAVLVIIGAVVGGVLGSRSANSSSDSSDKSSSSGNTTTTNTTSLTNIRSGSRLAATGWRDGTNYRIRLFYQGQDQKLRSSSYASNESAWSDPVSLSGVEHPAATDTMLGAAVSVQSSVYAEFKLFYFDEDLVLRGQGYRDYPGAAEQGVRLVLNDYPITVPSTSRIGAYWPFVMTQNSDKTLRLTTYHGTTDNWWTNKSLSLIGSEGAAMVVVPASAWYLDMGGVIYRRNDGSMINYLTDRDNNVTGTSWASGTLSVSIPDSSAIGAFVTARPNDSNNLTNTYILYQDDSGTIQTYWQDDASGWKGPKTYDAFSGADNGTDITCVTMAAWDGAGVELSSSQDMNRCYFQVNNQVREVYYDGSNWSDEGYLPIT